MDSIKSQEIDGIYITNGAVNIESYYSLRFAKTRDVKSPERGTKHSAGLDFFIPNDWDTDDYEKGTHWLLPQEKIVIPMGIYVDLLGSGLQNYMLRFDNKSGVAVKKGVVVGACVIDADYQGELMVHIYNTSEHRVQIKAGDKIIQGILIEVLYARPDEKTFEELYETKSDRGAGRFGSTGHK